jgi:hypothetical protein
MAQRIVSRFICGGRFRVHAIEAVDRRSGKIIEIEDVDSGERIHGAGKKLERSLRLLKHPTNRAALTLPR